jgi:hypothetical protein
MNSHDKEYQFVCQVGFLLYRQHQKLRVTTPENLRWIQSTGSSGIMNTNPKHKESIMSLTKNWYSVEEAAAKFGLNSVMIYECVEAGLVRAEEEKDRVVQVNGDDIERELQISPSV